MTTPQTTGVGDLGGNVAIETVTVINRATTAADVTYLKSMFIMICLWLHSHYSLI